MLTPRLLPEVELSETERNRDGLSPRICVGIWGVLSVLALLPFLLTPLPPLNDYPSHVARIHILATLSESTHLQQYYAIDWQLIPNLALDLVGLALAQIATPEVAVVLFVCLSLLLVSSGALAMNKALFGRLSAAPLAVFLILFNRQLLWGFIGYWFTLGLALWAFAGWVWLRDRSTALRLAIFIPAAFLLFVGHLHAFATYSVLVAGYEFSRAFQSGDLRHCVRRTGLAALQFIPPLIAFVIASPTRDKFAEVEYISLTAKLTGLADAFYAYSKALDGATMLIVFLLGAAGLLSGVLAVHRRMLLPLGALALLYVVMPTTLFGSFAADRRLMTSIYVLLAASTFWRYSGSVAAKAGLVTLAGLFLIRTGVVAANWREAGLAYGKVLVAIEELPAGTRLASAVAKLNSPFLEDPPVMYVASMAVVRRDAFVNTLFAEPGHQPLALKYRPADVVASRLPHMFMVSQSGARSNWRARNPFKRLPVDAYDYVLLLNPQYFRSTPPAELTLVASEPNLFALYRTARPNSPTSALSTVGSPVGPR